MADGINHWHSSLALPEGEKPFFPYAVNRTAEPAAEKLTIRIGLCLQA
jgi:hypothetical protein